jgi:DNA mismatch repair protein MutS2
LVTEEKKELYRILKDLSAVLRPFIDNLIEYQNLLSYFDEVQAKASLAHSLNAVKPKVFGKPKMGMKGAYHPLLYLKNKELKKETVPFD